MNVLGTLDLEGAGADTEGYEQRTAVRAVLIDEDGAIALMHVQADDFYKLPGGGVEAGESYEEALLRECLEETGCVLTDIRELGEVREIRQEERLLQTSLGYLARVQGAKGEPSFTEKERSRGCAVMWVPFEEALEKVGRVTRDAIVARYVAGRETLILEAARAVL